MTEATTTAEETTEETPKGPTKKEKRTVLQGAVKEAISAAGPNGCTG